MSVVIVCLDHERSNCNNGIICVCLSGLPFRSQHPTMPARPWPSMAAFMTTTLSWPRSQAWSQPWPLTPLKPPLRTRGMLRPRKGRVYDDSVLFVKTWICCFVTATWLTRTPVWLSLSPTYFSTSFTGACTPEGAVSESVVMKERVLTSSGGNYCNWLVIQQNWYFYSWGTAFC